MHTRENDQPVGPYASMPSTAYLSSIMASAPEMPRGPEEAYRNNRYDLMHNKPYDENKLPSELRPLVSTA